MSTASSSSPRARWAHPDYQLFRWVLLPAAVPDHPDGLRIGFTVALLSILGM